MGNADDAGNSSNAEDAGLAKGRAGKAGYICAAVGTAEGSITIGMVVKGVGDNSTIPGCKASRNETTFLDL